MKTAQLGQEVPAALRLPGSQSLLFDGLSLNDGLYAMKRDTSLPALLRQQVALQPDELCLVSADGPVTFADFADRTARLGSRLAGLGVGRDDCVGLYVDPSADLVLAAWGILHAGAAYLPLAPEYPEERLRNMLEDSGADTVVTQPHLVDRLRTLAPQGTRLVILGEALPPAEELDEGFNRMH